MKSVTTVILLIITLTAVAAEPRQTHSEEGVRYPNELANLKLFKGARWESIVPNVSTRDDVEKVLGEPSPVRDERFYDEKFKAYLVGYDYDPDWLIFVHYWGEGGDVPASAVGRVADIRLYPKARVSLKGVEFPRDFTSYSYIDRRNNVEGKVYYDRAGLRYSTYAKDTPDGLHSAGDLKVIIYGAPDEEEEN